MKSKVIDIDCVPLIVGDFPETDSCCRTHDHCPHVIHAFSSKYGYTNLKWYSICHCDCDIA